MPTLFMSKTNIEVYIIYMQYVGIYLSLKFWSGGPKFLENWSAGPLFSENFGPRVELIYGPSENTLV